MTQKQMLEALDAALAAHMSNTLFKVMVSAASGPNSEGPFEEGMKNALLAHAKAAEIIKRLVGTAETERTATRRTRRASKRS
jgi:hypothetical protein